jgi:hypothetical protein
MFLAPLALASLLALSGCRGYVPAAPEGETRVAIAPIMNESGPPQLIAPLARNLRERLHHARGWRVVDEADADATLRIRVSAHRREAISRDPADTGRPLSYFETVQLEVEWDGASPPWGDDPVRRIEADTLLYAQPSLVTAESAALAGIADDLARQLLALLNRPPVPPQP